METEGESEGESDGETSADCSIGEEGCRDGTSWCEEQWRRDRSVGEGGLIT